MSLTKKYEALIELFNEIKDEIEERDPNEYARWKAGGFILDTNIISMYPNLDEVVERLGDSEDEENTFVCSKCGQEFVLNEDGTTNHLKEDSEGVDDIDHDQDEDHVPYG